MHRPPKYFTVDTLASSILLCWGIGVANPYVNLFAENPRIFSPMGMIMSEPYWGLMYTFFGILGWTLILSGRHQGARLTNILCFTSISTLFFVGKPLSYAWSIYGLVAAWSFVKWWSSRMINLRMR